MERFSDRYGYTEPRRVFIKECLPKQVENCICTCIDDLNHNCCSFCGKMYMNVYRNICGCIISIGEKMIFI